MRPRIGTASTKTRRSNRRAAGNQVEVSLHTHERVACIDDGFLRDRWALMGLVTPAPCLALAEAEPNSPKTVDDLPRQYFILITPDSINK